MNSFADVQIRVDVGGSDYIPHTFVSITHPDGRQIEYGLGPAKEMSISGPGEIYITGGGTEEGEHEYQFSGDTIPLTEQQYRDLMRDINDAIANPPDYILPGSWWPTDGTNCTGWVIDLWSKHDFPDQFGVTNTWVWNPYGQGISLYARELWNQAKNWVMPRDPIILDLDGNGLQTVGLTSNIYFDHNGDGILSKTGWVGEGDALLVWDRNANGLIDNGAELFGDFTPMPDGSLAPNGFAALAALDANGDGILDASDPAFAELKLWVDSDQNGVTGEGELMSLADAGIASLNLGNTLKNQKQSNGNTLAREGSFTRTDGTESAMGEFHLAIDTFDTRFAEQIEVPESLRGLPMMSGSGNVRRSAHIVSPGGFDVGSGRNVSSGAGLASDSGSESLTPEYRALMSEWSNKLHVLEAFNGQYFFNLPDKKSLTPNASHGFSVVKPTSKPSTGGAAMVVYN